MEEVYKKSVEWPGNVKGGSVSVKEGQKRWVGAGNKDQEKWEMACRNEEG